ncbi:hypothetical protein [uncultured Brevundimonas sp.]|uniref:hypothetical protein n=1 Tax=uncultured Brevundimonas sp. TaxID=213418 RepID=UPI0025CFD19C|nr:hypothetical protein [uncultured Brevundimonas sp.]
MSNAFLLEAPSASRWVSVSEAARLEGEAGRAVNKSSISRFIDRNPDVPVRRDARNRVTEVDYNALAVARAQSLSVQDSRPTLAAPPTPTPAAPIVGSRKRDLEVEKLELDLAERKGELLSRAATSMAIDAIGVAFLQGLERRRRTLATQLVGISEQRPMELALKAADTALLNDLVGKLQKLAGDIVEPEQAAA